MGFISYHYGFVAYKHTTGINMRLCYGGGACFIKRQFLSPRLLIMSMVGQLTLFQPGSRFQDPPPIYSFLACRPAYGQHMLRAYVPYKGPSGLSREFCDGTTHTQTHTPSTIYRLRSSKPLCGRYIAILAQHVTNSNDIICCSELVNIIVFKKMVKIYFNQTSN